MTELNDFKTLFGYQYVQGYTAALQDVLATFDDIQDDLKRHKRKQTYKTYRAIVQSMLDNRVALREDPDAFIRCNDAVEGGFELWNGNWKERG